MNTDRKIKIYIFCEFSCASLTMHASQGCVPLTSSCSQLPCGQADELEEEFRIQRRASPATAAGTSSQISARDPKFDQIWQNFFLI